MNAKQKLGTAFSSVAFVCALTSAAFGRNIAPPAQLFIPQAPIAPPAQTFIAVPTILQAQTIIPNNRVLITAPIAPPVQIAPPAWTFVPDNRYLPQAPNIVPVYTIQSPNTFVPQAPIAPPFQIYTDP